MKNVFTIFIALLVSSAVFANRTTDPSAENSIAFIKTGSIVKVIYSSDKESNTRVTITDLKGKEVFSESVRSKNGFSRRYNLSQLGSGNYVFRVSDGKNTKTEVVSLQHERKVVHKVTELDADAGKYALYIPAFEATEVTINIYDEQLGIIHSEKHNIATDFARVYYVKNTTGKIKFEIFSN